MKDICVFHYTTENGSFSIGISAENLVFFNAMYVMAPLAIYACPDEPGYLSTDVAPEDEDEEFETAAGETLYQIPNCEGLTLEEIFALIQEFSENSTPQDSEQNSLTTPEDRGSNEELFLNMHDSSGNGVNVSPLPANVTVAPQIEPMVVDTESFSTDSDAIEIAAGSCFLLEIYDEYDDLIATGSGFVAFDSHVMVTNQHVIEDGAYFATISDNYEHQYELSYVLCQDSVKDIARVYFPDNDIAAPLPIGTGAMKRAEPVIVIGSPKGMLNMVSTGIVSNNVTEDGLKYIMFTASVSGESSGGAVFNNRGQVIGIFSAMLTGGKDLNYAIVIQYARELYEMIQENLP